MAHRTTWEAPYRAYKYKDGTIRKNPIRNQVDYAICRNQHRRFITDARSYSGTTTGTDHRLVIMKTNFQRKKMRHFKKVENKLHIQKLNYKEYQKQYQNKVEEYNTNTQFNE